MGAQRGPQAVRGAACPSSRAVPLTYPQGRGWGFVRILPGTTKARVKFLMAV